MDIQDVIQAFVDGEPVDPVELEQALADPEGRAHLVDLVVLRKLVRRSGTTPGIISRAALRNDPRSHRRLRAIAAAAVVSAVASVGGYFVGERMTTSGTSTVAVAPVPPAGSETQPAEAVVAPAPAPTVVIRFQPGVD